MSSVVIDMNMLRAIDMGSFLLTNQEQHFAFHIVKCSAHCSSAGIEVYQLISPFLVPFLVSVHDLNVQIQHSVIMAL